MRDRVFSLDADGRRRTAEALSAVLRAESDVVFAYLHGSFLADLDFHDIDVAVYLDAPEAQHLSRIVELADRLSNAVGFPVDVRPLNTAPVPFAFRALQGELLIVRDEDRLGRVLDEVGARYLDIAPVLLRATREAFAP